MLISDNVKFLPGSQIGRLEFIEEKEFIWTNVQEKFHVKMNQIETISIDKLGSTVLFTLKQGKGSKMVHFLKAEDLDCFEIVLMEFIGDNRDEFEEISNTAKYIQITRKPDTSDLDEATVNLLEAFSKIPLFARNIIGKIKGDPQNLRRPRGVGKTRIPLNPWIIDKPLKLPPSRIKDCEISVNSFSNLSFENQATMIYNSGGKLIEGNSEMRFKLWSAVLKNETVAECVTNTQNDTSHDHECYGRIEKDLNRLGEGDALVIERLERILKKYCNDDPEIGYVQGMSDLALPFARFSDEEASYEMFKGLMKRVRYNFMETSSINEGIESQLLRLRDLINSYNPLLGDYLKFNQDSDNLFFTYRWLLVLFRREFGGKDGDRLWDVMIAAEGCGMARIEEYRVFVALAMILCKKDEFMATCSRFEDLLKVRAYDIIC